MICRDGCGILPPFPCFHRVASHAIARQRVEVTFDMTDTTEQRPESLLPYDEWTEQALRQVVARALEHVANDGMPEGHHFYITFRTDYFGVSIPSRLKAQYPHEMTIVLQHQFWDLAVGPDSFSVGLSFGGVASTLRIPFAALLGFADPHVGIGLRFHADEQDDENAGEDVGEDDGEDVSESGKLATFPGSMAASSTASPVTAEVEQENEDSASTQSAPQVVSLDAFRRRKD
ncbi:Hypothetical protein GbCGDNIH2_1808 [Granulibacter bethesdensis]|nr:Hypothetical protein GbCGDNIH2_1808 [Granulibacter bethesdensis]